MLFIICCLLIVFGLGGGYFLGVASLIAFPILALILCIYYYYALLFRKEDFQGIKFSSISDYRFLEKEPVKNNFKNAPKPYDEKPRDIKQAEL